MVKNNIKTTLLEERLTITLEFAQLVVGKSHPSIKNDLKESLNRLLNIQKEEIDIISKIEKLNEICEKDFLTFILLFFSHHLFNGIQKWHISEFFNLLNGLGIKKVTYDKLVLTGYRGCGKSLLQILFVVWCSLYLKRVCFALIAHKQRNSSDMLDEVLSKYSDEYLSVEGDEKFNNLIMEKDIIGENTFFSLLNGHQVDKTFSGNKLSEQQRRQSVINGYELFNKVKFYPVSVGGRLRGLKGRLGRLDCIIADDIEDPSMIGTAEQEKVMTLLQTGFTADTANINKSIISIISGNWTEAAGNISQFKKWSEESPEKKFHFVSIPLVDRENKVSLDMNLTYKEAEEKIESSNRPEELLNNGGSGFLSVINMEKLKYISEDVVNNDGCYKILSVDGSYTKNKYNDSSGLGEILIGHTGNIYLSGHKFKGDTMSLIRKIIKKVQEEYYDMVILELCGNQTIFGQWFKEEIKKVWGDSPPFLLVEKTSKASGKQDRIQSLISFVVEPNVYILEKNIELIEDFASCTRSRLEKLSSGSKGIDLLDAMEQGIEHINQVGIESLQRVSPSSNNFEFIDTSKSKIT